MSKYHLNSGVLLPLFADKENVEWLHKLDEQVYATMQKMQQVYPHVEIGGYHPGGVFFKYRGKLDPSKLTPLLPKRFSIERIDDGLFSSPEYAAGCKA